MSIYKIYKSGEEEFDNRFGGEKVIAKTDENCILIGFTKGEVKQFRKQEYISIIKGEIEMMEKIDVSGGGSGRRLKEQIISHLQSELKAIEEDK